MAVGVGNYPKFGVNLYQDFCRKFTALTLTFTYYFP